MRPAPSPQASKPISRSRMARAPSPSSRMIRRKSARNLRTTKCRRNPFRRPAPDFLIQNLSVAVLINRAALTASLGDKAGPEAVAAQIKEIEQLVASAAGLDKQRGDVVKISVVDFVDSSRDLEPAPGPSIVEILARQTGSIVNAGAVVLVAAMVLWFGVRPGLKMLLASARGCRGSAAAPWRSCDAGARSAGRRPEPSHRIRRRPRRIPGGVAGAPGQWAGAQTAEARRVR